MTKPKRPRCSKHSLNHGQRYKSCVVANLPEPERVSRVKAWIQWKLHEKGLDAESKEMWTDFMSTYNELQTKVTSLETDLRQAGEIVDNLKSDLKTFMSLSVLQEKEIAELKKELGRG